MNIQTCLMEGLLKKDNPDFEKSKSSIKMAEHKLDLAERDFQSEIYENSIISAYASMFHSTRALLFKDGYKERSHFALYVYIKEKYSDKIEKMYLSELNSMRLERHELMYGLERSKESYEVEAESAIQVAKGFLKTVKKLLDQNSK